MKTFSKIIAVVMVVAIIAAFMAACGKYVDDRLVGTWVQTDEIDGNWTWTFMDDGKCNLTGGDEGFNSDGTYRFEGEGSGKLYIKLDEWGEEKVYTYTCTEKVLQMLGFDDEYYCMKQ